MEIAIGILIMTNITCIHIAVMCYSLYRQTERFKELYWDMYKDASNQLCGIDIDKVIETADEQMLKKS